MLSPFLKYDWSLVVFLFPDKAKIDWAQKLAYNVAQSRQEVIIRGRVKQVLTCHT
jgi:hypothetical protein